MSWQKKQRSDGKVSSQNLTRKPTIWVVAADHTGDINNGIAMAEAINPDDYKVVQMEEFARDVIFKRTATFLNPITLKEEEKLSIDASTLPDIIIDSTHLSCGEQLWKYREKLVAPNYYQSDILPMDKVTIVQMERPDIDVKAGAPTSADVHFDFTYRKHRDTWKQNKEWASTVPSRVNAERMTKGLEAWKGALSGLMAHPPLHTVILGNRDDADQSFALKDADKLGRELAELIKLQGGSVALSTSPRTKDAQEIVQRILSHLPTDVPTYVYDYSKGGENPYFGLLAAADHVVVTDDSMSMVSDAIASGKPTSIFERNVNSKKVFAMPPELQYAEYVCQQGFAQPLTKLLEHGGKTPPPANKGHNSATEMAEIVLEAWRTRSASPHPITDRTVQRPKGWAME